MKTDYLVIGRCGMDDVPLRLCSPRRAARVYALTVSEDQITDAGMEVMGVGLSMVCNVSILPFRNGKPGKAEVIKEFD